MRVFARSSDGVCPSSFGIVSSLLIVALAFVPLSPSAHAADDLMELSLQDLLDVEVTSVSKKSERRSEAAAAIYVISNEDIRRSTATSIPDLLRTVPGVNVAQLDAHTWSVTVRGQAGEFANKLLVLVDGRSVYTPLFSGVFWDTIDLVLEDIDDYLTLDARLAWRASESLEMSLNGRNLFDDDQIEFIEFISNRIPTGVERSVYGQITWEF